MKNSKDKLEFFKDRKKALRNMGAAAIKMEVVSWIHLPKEDARCLCRDSFTVLSGHQVAVINHLSREEATGKALSSPLGEGSVTTLIK